MRREAQSQPYETTSAFWQGRSTTTIRYRLTPSEVSIADETLLQITSQCGWETLKESKPHELSGCYIPPYVILSRRWENEITVKEVRVQKNLNADQGLR